jgi:uncharacterized repeat protein (TIGR03847 family)
MPDDPISQGGDALQVKAEALGEPGQRRFRLLAIIDGETKIVWLEKEQLGRLAQALDQVLDNLPDRGPEETTSGPNTTEFELESTHQIRAGRMELGFDETRNRLIIIAHDLEADDASAPAFVCRLSPGQARELAEEAASVVSAGRPLCPLCGRPIDAGGHACEKQNGHFPERFDEVRGEEVDEE